MKQLLLFSAAAFITISVAAADSNPKDEIAAAAKKLANSSNYTWRTTVIVPEDAQFKPGPTDGKTEKDNFTWISLSFFDNTTQAVSKGDKLAINTPDNGWQSAADMEKEEGPGQFFVAIMRNVKKPAVEAAELASYAKELKKDGDVYSSDLTDEGAKAMQIFKMPGAEPPTVSDAKGSVKFWVKDGALTKYEFKLKGNVSFSGNDFPNDRTTTVEIKDVGSTKIEVPDEAKKKLS